MKKHNVNLTQLVKNGLLTEEHAITAAEVAEADDKHPLTVAIHNGYVDGWDLAKYFASSFGEAMVNIENITIDPELFKKFDKKIIIEHNAIPFSESQDALYVAISDPTDVQIVEGFRFVSSKRVECLVTHHELLEKVIVEQFADSDSLLNSLSDDSLDLDGLEVDEDANSPDNQEDGANEAPIVKLVNQFLVDAIRRGASDIHIEPFETELRVRFRQDGVLQYVTKVPVNFASKIIARIKVMSRLNVTEKREPQDGRIKLKISKNKAIDFRVNTCPVLFGEKIVLRILDPTSATIGIENLGFEADQEEALMEAIHRPQGMVLVTGPTGSGKTVTLYTCLNILNTMERNISTAEDPVEINLKGINQVNVTDKMDFSKALKAFLRQDPDIIMVGEIRDIETGGVAIKAAQTGHMVLSTLHTNDAPQTLSRLVNMGIEPFNIASAVSLVVAQRLARRLCPNCKVEHELPRESLLETGFTEDLLTEGLKIYHANPDGCNSCVKGYKGRVGIYQVMPVSEPIAAIIMNRGTALDVAEQARKENIRSLRESGIRKVAMGLTSIEEVERVTAID